MNKQKRHIYQNWDLRGGITLKIVICVFYVPPFWEISFREGIPNSAFTTDIEMSLHLTSQFNLNLP